MDILKISLCFVALFTYSLGLEDALVVKFENSSRIDTLEGAEKIQMRCHLNRGPLFVVKNKINIIHVDPVTSKETTMSSTGELVDGKPEFYIVNIDQHPETTNSMIIDFTIVKVRYEDDGIYRCKVLPGSGSDSTETASDDREIVVHRPLSSLKLKMGDFDALTESPSDPLAIDHGQYKVSCIAEGANPATKDVRLSFHGLQLNHTDPVVAAMEGDKRMFSTSIEGNLNIMVSNSGQDLVCQAFDSTGQTKAVALSIKVNVYDPTVSCNDSSAYVGQLNPMLYCTVNHTGLEVDSFAYQIGDTGEIVKEGEDHFKNIKVTVTNVEEGISVVALDLHKAEAQYLDKNYYILTNLKGGHTSKESVRLNRIDAPTPGGQSGPTPVDPGQSGLRISSTALTLVMVAVTALWSVL